MLDRTEEEMDDPVLSQSQGHNQRFNEKFKGEKFSGSSYMGVFNSPVVEGRRRRVDIKLYPYRERAFASLYFTGNGFFNR